MKQDNYKKNRRSKKVTKLGVTAKKDFHLVYRKLLENSVICRMSIYTKNCIIRIINRTIFLLSETNIRLKMYKEKLIKIMTLL